MFSFSECHYSVNKFKRARTFTYKYYIFALFNVSTYILVEIL